MRSVGSAGSRPLARAAPHRSLRRPQPQIDPASRPTVSSDRPNALPTSRTAPARAVADDRGGDAGPVAAVFGVDVLDHLLAPLVLEIHVDVGRLVARGGNEALEQQVVRAGSTAVTPRQ